MRLSDYLREGLVIHNLEVSHVAGVLEAVEAHLEDSGLLTSRTSGVGAPRAKDEVHTTALGKGVAVPHGTLSDLEETLVLVARTSTPVTLEPQEDQEVDLFFVILSPPGREGEHLKLLARICRLAQHPGLLDELRDAPDGDTLLQRILGVDSLYD